MDSASQICGAASVAPGAGIVFGGGEIRGHFASFGIPRPSQPGLSQFVTAHDRRRILPCNVTKHPSSAWVIQQLREAFFMTRHPAA